MNQAQRLATLHECLNKCAEHFLPDSATFDLLDRVAKQYDRIAVCQGRRRDGRDLLDALRNVIDGEEI